MGADDEHPKSKHQAPENLQTSISNEMKRHCVIRVTGRLEFEDWNFSGAWMLALGASRFVVLKKAARFPEQLLLVPNFLSARSPALRRAF